MESENRTCQNCKANFSIEPQDFGFYEKMAVPPPTFCPECRLKRRLAWRNGRLLFRRKDDASGKEIFSGFPPNIQSTVYDHEYWKSDAWDPLQYGREYDFSRPFFEQFRELLYSVPWPSKSVQGMVNSDYCDQAGYFKNCYLCFNGDRMEDSAYTTQCTACTACFDCALSNDNQSSYECVSVNNSYRTVFSEDCEACVDVWFSKNCTNCTNCFGCVNQRGKSFCFFNEQYSKEEYEKKIAELKLDSWSGLQTALKKTREFSLAFPNKYYRGFRIIDSSGDYLHNVKNVKSSYFVDDAQDSKYLYNIYLGTKDCYDYGPWGNNATQMYECLTCGDQCNQEKFCFESWPSCRAMEYAFFCRSSSDCFGCVSLKKKQYCILNKQYTKEEYERLVPKIIEQMNALPYKDAKGNIYKYGEFCPDEFSPFAYNETARQEIFPLTKEEATAKNVFWRDPDVREYETTRTADSLPATIAEVSEEILKELIQCSSCKRAYRIIASELQFLRQMNLPLPRTCVPCRAARRASLVNPPRYFERQCECGGEEARKNGYKNNASHVHGATPCSEHFETSYAPDRPEIVYCESCYQAEVV